MAIRNIRMLGDAVLTKKCREVKEMTGKLQTLIDDMFETMYEQNGVGLAAPQVGVLKRIVVIDTGEEGEQVVLINPVIEQRDGEQRGYEGCLSLPGKSGIVTRPEHVVVRALDENMEEFVLEASDLLARAICHECDHLEGIMYTSLVEGRLYDNSELQEQEEEEEEA